MSAICNLRESLKIRLKNTRKLTIEFLNTWGNSGIYTVFLYIIENYTKYANYIQDVLYCTYILYNVASLRSYRVTNFSKIRVPRNIRWCIIFDNPIVSANTVIP